MIGFVKVVKCSFKEDTWYFNSIGEVFFIYAISDDQEWLIPYTPIFSFSPIDEYKRQLITDLPTLLIHKSDVIPWQG